jgi:hypothetical protein
MWESPYSPTSDGDVENIDSGEKGNEKRRRICQGCELKCRTEDAKAFGDKTANELAEKLLSVIKSGRFFGAFITAGSRIQAHIKVSDELQDAYDAYLKLPSEELLEKLKEIEKKEEE